MSPAFTRAHPRLWLVLAFVVAAALCAIAAVSAVALVNNRDNTSKAAGAGPIRSPLPTATGAPTPTASPSPSTPKPSPSPSPSTPKATPSPTSTPAGKPSASAASVKAASKQNFGYPKPTSTYPGLVLRASLSEENGATTRPFMLTLKATDGDGNVAFNGVDWGDGEQAAAEPDPTRCKDAPTPTSQPPAYQPQPSERNGSFRHSYRTAGTYQLVVRAISRNGDCRPHGPRTENAETTFTVTVTAPPSPSPTAA